DDPGRKAFADHQTKLDDAGIPAITCHLWENSKDANELFCTDPDQFEANLRETAENAAAILERQNLEEDAEYRKTSVQGQMAEFCAAIRGNSRQPAISTGIPPLDKTLGGGLFPGLYILGAVSSLGKTTFLLQMAEYIAACGRDVMIFSLEMSRMELIAKGVSRETYLLADELEYGKGDALSAREILQYDLCSEHRKTLFEAALPRFESHCRHLFICEGDGRFSVDDMRDALYLHRRKTGRYPVVILDYLQILTPRDVNATDKQNTDRAVTDLKQLSRSLDVPVLAISSINRAGYRNAMELNAFKESGSIEYGADVLMGLEFRGVGEKDFDLEAAKRNFPRKINLRILKNRSGESGALIPLEYYAKFNFFRAG
ncbi:MAG: DNA primase, partial [Firmicutes bacterium]|nr:DNA primase [Bacillota bacterium]